MDVVSMLACVYSLHTGLIYYMFHVAPVESSFGRRHVSTIVSLETIHFTMLMVEY